MKTLLQRRLNGYNEIVEVDDDCKDQAGVADLPKFLRDVGLGTYDCFLELGQVLKVPYDQLVECDLIEKQAQDNIREYVLSGRISPRCLEFMSAQHGEAGTKNWPPRDDNPD